MQILFSLDLIDYLWLSLASNRCIWRSWQIDPLSIWRIGQIDTGSFIFYLFTDSLFLNPWTRIFVSGLLDRIQYEIFQLTDRSIDKVVKVVACGIDFAQATAVCLWPPATLALRTNHRFPRSLAFRRLFKCALSFSLSLVFKILPDRKNSQQQEILFSR